MFGSSIGSRSRKVRSCTSWTLNATECKNADYSACILYPLTLYLSITEKFKDLNGAESNVNPVNWGAVGYSGAVLGCPAGILWLWSIRTNANALSMFPAADPPQGKMTESTMPPHNRVKTGWLSNRPTSNQTERSVALLLSILINL